MKNLIMQARYTLLSWLNQTKNNSGSRRTYSKKARYIKHSLNPDSDITVLINVWKRDHLTEQIRAIEMQSCVPREIWILQCGNHVDIGPALKKFPFLHVISSSVNLKYFGRFSLALFVQTDFLFVVDDDVIPGRDWLANCHDLCNRERAVVASAGRIIPAGDFQPESLKNIGHHFIGDVESKYSFNFCEADTKVDFGCNSWFLRTSWIRDFWSLSPYTLETGEDIHLAASMSILNGIDTIVPRQIDEYSTGNLKKAYGQDDHASWKRHNFLPLREEILRYFISERRWLPIQWHRIEKTP